MNGKTRSKLYAILITKQEEQCVFCGKKPPEVQLVIDHKDNDNANNSLSNLQLSCRRCNYLKNPRRPLDMCVRSESQVSAIAVNREKEPKFRNYVCTQIDEYGYVEYEELITDGAEVVGISPETAKRYLKKMCSKSGKLEKVRDTFWHLSEGKTKWYIQYKKIEAISSIE